MQLSDAGFMNSGGITMTLSIKDPGSAITHFIGMILAAAASTPLLVTAAGHNGGHSVPALVVFALSMVMLYGASTLTTH